MTKKMIFLIVALSLVLIPLKAQDYRIKEIVSVEKKHKTIKKLQEMNLDFLMERNNRVYVIVGYNDFLKLHEENILYTLETYNFYPFKQKKLSLQGGVNGAFHSYREVEQELLNLENTYPEIASVLKIGESLEGRNIYALKISDHVHLDENEAEVLFIGCHHAREWISVEVPLMLGKYLAENYGNNSEVKDIVDQSEIWIVPLLNPDGLDYSIHFYRYWRKNRRDNGDGTYGVDLNRNYGYRWGYDDRGSSPNTASNVYRGMTAFSEPETQVIRDFYAGRNFQAMITYHNYSQLILYPWGYTEELTEQNDLLSQIAADMSGLIESVNGRIYVDEPASSLYLTNGDTTDWSFGVYGIPSFTIELPPEGWEYGGFFNPEEDIQPIFNENLPAALYLIDWSIQNVGSPTEIPERKRMIPEKWMKKPRIREKQLKQDRRNPRDSHYKPVKREKIKDPKVKYNPPAQGSKSTTKNRKEIKKS